MIISSQGKQRMQGCCNAGDGVDTAKRGRKDQSMEKMEKAEKLREKAGVSLEEAKKALEACDYDILDAMIYLERQGKAQGGGTADYTTASEGETSSEFEKAQKKYEEDCRRSSAGETLRRLGGWCCRLLQKSTEYDFCVIKGERMVLKAPVLALILAALLAFELVLILLLVGLFCGYKYFVQSADGSQLSVNQVFEKAAESCEEIKRE